MAIVLFGTYESQRQPRMAVLREGLRAHGMEVLECNEPLGVDTGLRVETLRRPWLAVVLAMRIAVRWVRLWRRARRIVSVSAVVVGYMGEVDVLLARRLWRRVPVVLDHMTSLRETAEDRAVSSGFVKRVLGRFDRAALRAADIVMVDTEEHRELVPSESRGRTVVAPIGAGEGWFRSSPAPEKDWLRVVFYGAFTPLQGAPVIGEAIALVRDRRVPVRFTMIGHGQDLERTRRAAGETPDVRWVPWVDASELPSIVGAHDVCLGIFGTSPKAMRVVPHKIVEGAAAGCAIVTSDTPPQCRTFGDAAVYVPPGDAEQLAATLEMLAGDRQRVRELRKAARELAHERLSAAAVAAPLATAIASGRR